MAHLDHLDSLYSIMHDLSRQFNSLYLDTMVYLDILDHLYYRVHN